MLKSYFAHFDNFIINNFLYVKSTLSIILEATYRALRIYIGTTNLQAIFIDWCRVTILF